MMFYDHLAIAFEVVHLVYLIDMGLSPGNLRPNQLTWAVSLSFG